MWYSRYFPLLYVVFLCCNILFCYIFLIIFFLLTHIVAFLFMVFGLSSSIWWAISASIMCRQLQNHKVWSILFYTNILKTKIKIKNLVFYFYFGFFYLDLFKTIISILKKN